MVNLYTLDANLQWSRSSRFTFGDSNSNITCNLPLSINYFVTVISGVNNDFHGVASYIINSSTNFTSSVIVTHDGYGCYSRSGFVMLIMIGM